MQFILFVLALPAFFTAAGDAGPAFAQGMAAASGQIVITNHFDAAAVHSAGALATVAFIMALLLLVASVRQIKNGGWRRLLWRLPLGALVAVSMILLFDLAAAVRVLMVYCGIFCCDDE